MKKRNIFVLAAMMAWAACGCEQKQSSRDANAVDSTATEQVVCQNPSGFKINHGVNISHWMSQRFGWSPYDTFITRDDVRLLDSLGFDHVRLPIDEENLWSEDGSMLDTSMQRIRSCIDWCIESDMRVIVDLHILRSHHFNAQNNEGKMTLWTDTTAQNNFMKLWKDLSAQLKDYPVSMVAYELMNEPVAPEHEMWNALIARCVSQLRAMEPERVLVIGSNRWQIASTYPYLQVPENDKNIILSFHTYDPYLVTHHKAYWSVAKYYEGPVFYPGVTIPKDVYEQNVDTTNAELVARMAEEKVFEVHDRNTLSEIMKPAIEKSKELGLQLYCSEFGCLPNIPDSTRHAYYSDITSVLRENNIAYANWDYKGDFGIRKWNRTTLANETIDTAVVRILVK